MEDMIEDWEDVENLEDMEEDNQMMSPVRFDMNMQITRAPTSDTPYMT